MNISLSITHDQPTIIALFRELTSFVTSNALFRVTCPHTSLLMTVWGCRACFCVTWSFSNAVFKWSEKAQQECCSVPWMHTKPSCLHSWVTARGESSQAWPWSTTDFFPPDLCSSRTHNYILIIGFDAGPWFSAGGICVSPFRIRVFKLRFWMINQTVQSSSKS